MMTLIRNYHCLSSLISTSIIILVISLNCVVNGSLFVKYETTFGSSISIPIESVPPASLINAPSWISISGDNNNKESSQASNGQSVVLLLKGTAQALGDWTFSIADSVGIVSIQIHVAPPQVQTINDGSNGDIEFKSADKGNIYVDGPPSNEILEPSHDIDIEQLTPIQVHDQVVKKKRSKRNPIIQGSGGGSHGHLGHGAGHGAAGDDEDYDEDDEEDEDYEDEDDDDDNALVSVNNNINNAKDNDNEVIEERRRLVPIEPTPTLPILTLTTTFNVNEDQDPMLTSSSTMAPTAAPIPEITPSPATPPHTSPVTSPILLKAEYIEFGSGLEPNPKVIEEERVQPPIETGGGHHHHHHHATGAGAGGGFHKTHRNLEKFAIYSGKLFITRIPSDLFAPGPSESNKIIYTIEPLTSTTAEGGEPWIWISDDQTQAHIHALPTDKDISDYNLTLMAERVDSGEKAAASLLISVRQSRRWRMYNHEIEVGWSNTGAAGAKPIDIGVQLIRSAFGGGGSWADDDIIVRRFESEPGGGYKLYYTNETLLVGHSQNICPVTELSGIAAQLKASRGFDYVTIHFTGSLCEGVKEPVPEQEGAPGGGGGGTGSAGAPPVVPVIPPSANFPPDIKNPLDVIDGVQGEYLIRAVRSDFCYDPEDGDTRQLHLTLVDEDMKALDDTHWLQFDEKNQEFYGLPGVSGEYTLVCTDSGGKSANDAIHVTIAPQPVAPASNYLSMNLHFTSSDFKPSTIRKFMSRLASAFNDSDLSNIIVVNYQESSTGQNTSNVHFTWINRTNPSTEYEITSLRRRMLSNDGPPKREFIEHFAPEFKISVGELIPSRAMIGGGTVHTDVKMTNLGSDGADDDDLVVRIPEWLGGLKGFSSQDLITYVIPAILIFIMIFLALMIACCLTRSSRKSVPAASKNGPGTRYVTGGGNNALLKKGVPVIFQDEYFDEAEAQALNDSRSRSPAILRDEHPPLPPQYRRHHAHPHGALPPSSSAGSGVGSAFGSGGRGGGNNNMGMGGMNIQSYQPPPGFNTRAGGGGGGGSIPLRQSTGFGGGGNVNNFGNRGGSGRNPPPYVPP